MIKTLTVLCMIGSLMGCGQKKGFFEREGDRLTVSPCAKCSEPPFYIKGHWVHK
jgi:hypothetical protein